MLGFLTTAARPAPRRVVPPPAPPALPPDYVALATGLGLRLPQPNPRLAAAHAEATALAEMGVTTFDLAAVDRYLTRLARKEGSRWAWAPLRPRDAIVEGSRREYNSRVPFHGELETEPYTHLVPGRVLAVVRDIGERLPAAHFYVSDYRAADPDPFIMFITTAALYTWVFDVWDEPGFTG